MAALADVIGGVLAKVPGCPVPVAKQYMRTAAIRFCRDTFVWTETLAAVALEADDFPYSIPVDTGEAVEKVLSVVVGGQAPALEEVSTRGLELTVDDWQTTTGTPTTFINHPKGVVSVVPVPDVETQFSFTVAYAPAGDADSLPDVLVADWIEAITDGAAAELFALPGKPWSSIDLSAFYARRFAASIDDAKEDLHYHHVRRPLTTSISTL